MGKKSTPPAPDYKGAAEQTAASSQDAQTRSDWANRPTVNTPWGQESWQASAAVDPSTGKPITNWTQNTKLNPLAQSTLDSTMTVDRDKALLAQGMMGRAAAATSKPFDWGNMQGYGQAPQAGGLQSDNFQSGLQAGNLQPGASLQAGNIQGGERLQAGNLQAGNLQAGNLDPRAYQSSGAGQGMMAGLDMGRLGGMPQGDAAERQRIEGMLYDRQNPERMKQQAGLEGKLANMGLTRGSEAWNREMQRMGDQHSRERYDAMQTGGQEMQRTFNMGMQGRQQGWNELLGGGQFQNAAQNQAFGQGMNQNAQNFAQQAQAGAQNFGQQAQAGAQNFGQQQAAGAQNFGQQRDSQAQFFDQMQRAGAQNFGQQAQAGAQNFGQQQAAGAQNFGQQAQASEAQRLADAQRFGQQAQAGQQNFAQGMDAANYNNKLRQQQIAEQQMQRQMPLNELNALLSGTQVGQLQTPDFNASRSAGGADYSGAARNQYNAGMDAYNAKQSQTQGMMSGLSGLASTAMMFSDRRLKTNVVRVGTHPLGVGVYDYDIFGQRQRGVMAQELVKVAPRLVGERDGFLTVDYRGL
jgi:hypothetical protein